MFNYLPLLIVFGFLAVFDLLDSKRINILFILIGAFVLFFMNNFTLLKGTMFLIGVFSIIILFFIKSLGMGDKIVLSASFLIYPFYWMWLILTVAILISKPVLKIKSFFYSLFHKERVSVAFYPFLFISTLLIVIIMNTIKII